MGDSNIRVILNINKRRRLRNMDSLKSIILENKKDNNVNRIIDYSANLDNTDIISGASIIDIESTAVIQNNAINLDNIIFPENSDYLNTNKVQELISKGEIDFSEKYTNENYTINIYKIQDISQGCEFNILTDKNINTNKNSINITTKLIEDSTSNMIDVNCTLIPSNNNIIKCISNQELNNYYNPNDFIYYDEDELLILLNENKESNYNLSCKTNSDIPEAIKTTIINNIEPASTYYSPNPSISKNSKSSGSSSTGMLIGIIAGIIVLIAGIVLIAYCIYQKKCKRQTNEEPFDFNKIGNISETKIQIEISSYDRKNDDKNIQNVKFTTGTGIIQYVSIEPDKKIKDLIKEYFKKIKRPDLFGDKNIVILCCGNQINNSNYDLLISEFAKKNGCDGNLAFIVMNIDS